VLDFDDKTNEELIAVHPDLVKFLKPHQVRPMILSRNKYKFV